MKHLEYFHKIEEQLKEQIKEEGNIEKAAQYCAESIRALDGWFTFLEVGIHK